MVLQGTFGQDTSPPEFKQAGGYSPFPVDVYHFGNMLMRFLDEYQQNNGTDILRAAARKMVNANPNLRPIVLPKWYVRSAGHLKQLDSSETDVGFGQYKITICCSRLQFSWENATHLIELYVPFLL